VLTYYIKVIKRELLPKTNILNVMVAAPDGAQVVN
jgi:hypothetical protein